jgi:3-oxoacyl-[acyl-carrier protein] reductase
MKYALVTGASGGIGRAVALKLAREGFSIIVHYGKNRAEAEKTLQQIEIEDNSGELIQFDTSKPEEIFGALKHWKEKHPESIIHTLVNNAGVRKDNLLVFMTQQEWDEVIDTNLNSFYALTKSLMQDMIVNKGGRIINVVSLSGLKGMPGQTNYSAAKAGVIAAAKALAQETARKKITVNCVAPGFIKTKMTEDLDEKELKKNIPMRRFGRADEVAELVSFLASEKSAYITGEVISINGGLF